jgi:hypothetical protein
MGVLRYIPRKKEIIDRRSSEGGYYESECDHCGSIYYPKRSSAKFCSRSCTVMAYRMTKNEKKAIRDAKKGTFTKIGDCYGYDEVLKLLSSNGYSLHLRMGDTKQTIKYMDIGDRVYFDAIVIEKLSDRKYIGLLDEDIHELLTMK